MLEKLELKYRGAEAMPQAKEENVHIHSIGVIYTDEEEDRSAEVMEFNYIDKSDSSEDFVVNDVINILTNAAWRDCKIGILETIPRKDGTTVLFAVARDEELLFFGNLDTKQVNESNKEYMDEVCRRLDFIEYFYNKDEDDIKNMN